MRSANFAFMKQEREHTSLTSEGGKTLNISTTALGLSIAAAGLASGVKNTRSGKGGGEKSNDSNE